jgi:hypothetical protein
MARSKAQPTTEQFATYEAMYRFFNDELFGGRLPSVILNFSRHAGTYGFFAPERWAQSEGKSVTQPRGPWRTARKSRSGPCFRMPTTLKCAHERLA